MSSDFFPASTGPAWPYSPGSNPTAIDVNTATSHLWHAAPNNRTSFTETPHGVESFSPIDPYATPIGRQQYQQQQQPQQQLQTPTSQSAGSSTLDSLGFHLPPQLQTNMQNYPSPQYSDVSGPTFRAHQKMVQGAIVSPRMPVAASPSIAGSSESRQSSHKSLEPTRNAQGVLFCSHPEHGFNAPTFARKCEWR